MCRENASPALGTQYKLSNAGVSTADRISISLLSICPGIFAAIDEMPLPSSRKVETAGVQLFTGEIDRVLNKSRNKTHLFTGDIDRVLNEIGGHVIHQPRDLVEEATDRGCGFFWEGRLFEQQKQTGGGG